MNESENKLTVYGYKAKLNGSEYIGDLFHLFDNFQNTKEEIITIDNDFIWIYLNYGDSSVRGKFLKDYDKNQLFDNPRLLSQKELDKQLFVCIPKNKSGLIYVYPKNRKSKLEGFINKKTCLHLKLEPLVTDFDSIKRIDNISFSYLSHPSLWSDNPLSDTVAEIKCERKKHLVKLSNIEKDEDNQHKVKEFFKKIYSNPGIKYKIQGIDEFEKYICGNLEKSLYSYEISVNKDNDNLFEFGDFIIKFREELLKIIE